MIAALALLIWLYLFFLHGNFWKSEPELLPALPGALPAVDIVIPARDEAGSAAVEATDQPLCDPPRIAGTAGS